MSDFSSLSWSTHTSASRWLMHVDDESAALNHHFTFVQYTNTLSFTNCLLTAFHLLCRLLTAVWRYFSNYNLSPLQLLLVWISLKIWASSCRYREVPGDVFSKCCFYQKNLSRDKFVKTSLPMLRVHLQLSALELTDDSLSFLPRRDHTEISSSLHGCSDELFACFLRNHPSKPNNRNQAASRLRPAPGLHHIVAHQHHKSIACVVKTINNASEM